VLAKECRDASQKEFVLVSGDLSQKQAVCKKKSSGSSLRARTVGRAFRRRSLYTENRIVKEHEKLDGSAQRLHRELRAEFIENWKEYRVACTEYKRSKGRYAHLYPVPEWGDAMRLSYSAHCFSLNMSYERAGSAVDASGDIVDFSVLELTEQPSVGDILFVSRLVSEQLATVDDDHKYFSNLDNMSIDFSAWQEERRGSFSYMFSMLNNSVGFGVVVPIVEQLRHISIYPILSDVMQDSLADSTINDVFRRKYGSSVSSFIKDILKKKGMKYRKNMSKTSFDDIQFFCNVVMKSKGIERCVVGVSLAVPCADRCDKVLFFAPRIGNGGFLSTQLFAGLLLKKRGHIWPHVRIACDIAFPSTVKRRVPRIVSASGSLPSAVVMKDSVTFTGTVEKVETEIPAFASEIKAVTIQPGFRCSLGAGVVIMPFISRLGQLDLSYKYSVQGGLLVHGNLPVNLWNVKALKRTSYTSAHVVQAMYEYQPDERVHLQLGLYGTISGRYVPLKYGGTCGIRYEW